MISQSLIALQWPGQWEKSSFLASLYCLASFSKQASNLMRHRFPIPLRYWWACFKIWIVHAVSIITCILLKIKGYPFIMPCMWYQGILSKFEPYNPCISTAAWLYGFLATLGILDLSDIHIANDIVMLISTTSPTVQT